MVEWMLFSMFHPSGNVHRRGCEVLPGRAGSGTRSHSQFRNYLPRS